MDPNENIRRDGIHEAVLPHSLILRALQISPQTTAECSRLVRTDFQDPPVRKGRVLEGDCLTCLLHTNFFQRAAHCTTMAPINSPSTGPLPASSIPSIHGSWNHTGSPFSWSAICVSMSQSEEESHVLASICNSSHYTLVLVFNKQTWHLLHVLWQAVHSKNVAFWS